MSKVVAVFGGCGQLGQVVINHFKSAAWKTVSIDVRASDVADHAVVIKGDGSREDSQGIVSKIKEWKLELDSVISVAGGFLMGNIKDENIFAQTEKMLSFNLKSAISSAHVASHCLKENGLLVLTGAYSALNPTPAFLAYGVSKAATHHLIESLAQEGSGMPKGSTVVGMLPVMLDTPQNRKDMPSANFDSWTPLEDVAKILHQWSDQKDKPTNGSLIQVKTNNKVTTFNAVAPVNKA